MSRIVIVLLALLLSSCAGMMPEPNPAYISRIDSYFTQAKSKTYGDSGKFTAPVPYKVGQYVTQGITGQGERSISTMAIVGQEFGGWIIETRSLTPTADSISQMLIKGLDTAMKTNSIKDIDIVWLKTKADNQPVQTIDGAMLSMAESFVKPALEGLLITTSALQDGGSQQVPAGTFKGATASRSEVSFLGKKYISDVWLHPAVPLNGMVKSVANTGQTIELLDFGMKGAVRSF